MSNGFYKGYSIEKGTLPMMCIGELCWQWVEDELGGERLMVNGDLQMLNLIECGGGLSKKKV